MKRAQQAKWALLTGCMALNFSSCSSCSRSLPADGAARPAVCLVVILAKPGVLF